MMVRTSDCDHLCTLRHGHLKRQTSNPSCCSEHQYPFSLGGGEATDDRFVSCSPCKGKRRSFYVRQGWLPFPETVSFRHHVYPLLQRLSRLQWVNKGYATQFGPGGPNNFENPEYVAKL